MLTSSLYLLKAKPSVRVETDFATQQEEEKVFLKGKEPLEVNWVQWALQLAPVSRKDQNPTRPMQAAPV